MSVFTFHEAVAAVCPIYSAEMPDPNDRTTWRVWFREEATDDQKAAAQAVIDSYVNPPDPVTLTFQQFLGLFTPAEQAAIIGSTDLQIKLWTLKAAAADQMTLGDDQTKLGLSYAVSVGILTADRKAAILANTPPV